jgi:hypothetical protein
MPLFGEWDMPEAQRVSLASIRAAGVDLKPGDHVRLRPQRQADIMDLVLAGRIATIESIEQDFEDRIHVAVTVDDDPGQDWGRQHKPGHRFFFQPDELEPLDS